MTKVLRIFSGLHHSDQRGAHILVHFSISPQRKQVHEVVAFTLRGCFSKLRYDLF